MMSLLRKASSTQANKDEKFSQEKIVASPATTNSANTTLSSGHDDSSKMSASEVTPGSLRAPTQSSTTIEQPGLMLASEEETLPQHSDDKEVAIKDRGTTDAYDVESGTHTTLPVYEERDTLTKSTDHHTDSRETSLQSQDLKSDLLTQEVLAPDSNEKEIASPQRTTSTYSMFKPTSQQQSRSYREYSFYYTNTMTHLIICDPDSRALFFAESSVFTRGKSDILLYDIANAPDSASHRGSSLSYKEAVNAPIVASADFVQANNVKIGLGDPLQPESARWLMMRNIYNDPKNNVEKFEVLATDISGKPGDVVYQWNKGEEEDEEGSSKWRRKSTSKTSSKETFRMTSGDDMVASFRNASMTSIKKRGHLRIFETERTDDLMLLVFLSFVSLCEKQRRRKLKKSLLMGM